MTCYTGTVGREALLQALMDRQGTGRQVDFAARLGITQAHWSNLRRGERPLTDRLVRRVRDIFPDLEPLCIAALLTRDSDAA